jgi:hypothetical protein
LPPVQGEHHNLVVGRPKVDGVGEPRHHRSTNLAVHAVEHEGVRRDSADECVELKREFVPEPGSSRLVPRLYFNCVVFGLWPKDNLRGRHLREELRAYVGPGNGGPGIGNVFGPTTIELGALVVGERELTLALTIRKALPKRQRELGPIASRKLEQFDKRTRWHTR